MATVPSSNATATRYAANGKDIWVPSQEITGASVNVGNKALVDSLKHVYGKIFTTKPTGADVQQDALFFGNDGGHNKLQYYDTVSGWITILDTSAEHIYHTVLQNTETFEEAAQRELYQKGGQIGDRVLVTDSASSPTEYEVFTMVGGDSSTTSSAVVMPETTETAAEISVENSGNKPYLTTDVETSLANLSDAVTNTTDFGRYKAVSPSAGTELTFESGQGVIKNFTNYTGQVKFTCVISCTDLTANYRSTGVITCFVIDGTIDPDSMALTEYYVGPSLDWVTAHQSGTATSGPGSNLDIFNLDFEIISGVLHIAVPSGSTVAADTTVTVKVQW